MSYEYFIGPEGVFPSELVAVLFTVFQFGFMATESRRRRLAPHDARRIGRAFPPLGLAILMGLTARLVCGFLKIGTFGGSWREALVWLGAAMVLAGWGVRFWAQQALGKYFTGEVAVQRDHQVVQSGPYRWVRHPAYTGGVLSAVGFGLMLSTWLGALISGAMLVWAYVVRVPREEALLLEQLGETYRSYMSRTKRFLPFVF